MATLRRLLNLLMRRPALDRDRDLDDEVRGFAQELIERRVRAGMLRAEARRVTLAEMGGIEPVKEQVREVRPGVSLELALKDIALAWRGLRRDPVFTAVVVLALALGIGANSAVFTLIDAIAWRPLPVRDPNHLYAVGLAGENVPLLGRQGGGDGPPGFTYPQFRAMRDAGVAELAGYSAAAFPVPLAFDVDGQLQPGLFGQLVSGNYFELLGVQPAFGRLITPADDRFPDEHPVAVISYALWQQRFGGESTIAGRRVSLDGTPFEIIGVAPSHFTGLDVGSSPDVYLPMMMQATVMPVVGDLLQRPTVNRTWVQTVARLRAGMTPQQLEAALHPHYLEATPAPLLASPVRVDARVTLAAMPYGLSGLRTQFSGALRILMALVGVVLLIACANVANLLLARAAARRHELAVRLAIGAGRWRLARQLASEHLLLATIGGVAGLVLARLATTGLVAYLSSPDAPVALDVAPNARILGFTAGTSILTALLVGLAPIHRAGATDAASVMKRATGRRRHGATPLRPGRLLAIAQVAFSLVLLAGAALFVRSLQHLYAQDPSIPRDRILVVRVEPRGSNQRNPPGVAERLDATYRQLLQRVRAIPGVQAASLSNVSPVKPESGAAVLIPTRGASRLRASSQVVYPGYFQTLGLRIVTGREFTEIESARTASVCVVNQAFVRLAYPGEDPIGRPCHSGGDRVSRIVGVVDDVRYTNLRGPAAPAVYQPFMQASTGRGQMILYARTVTDPSAVRAAIAEAVRTADPTVPQYAVRTLDEELGAVLVRDRLMATLAGLFGGLSLLLAAVGVYGLLSFSVARRTGELAVRIALGAGRATILRLVMREAVLLIAAGVAIGVPLAVLAARASAATLSSIVSGVQPVDAASLFAGALILIVIGGLAAYVPSARASRLQPMAALRAEAE